MKQKLHEFNQTKSEIVGILREIGELLGRFGKVQDKEAIEELARETEEEKFSIIVSGQFSAGKSTFLNALMGKRILPSYSKETTATINYLKSAEESPTGKPMIRIRYKDGREETNDDVSLETIERYVSTKSDIDVVSDVEFVELFIESKFLNDGISLIDSPGLNGVAKGHGDITRQEYKKSHAGIFMFNAGIPGSETDYEILHEMKEQYDSIIYVLNKIDLIKEAEQETPESVIENLKKNYKTIFPEDTMPEIWPVDAYQALVARNEIPLEYNREKWDSQEQRTRLLKYSRIEAFEDRLIRFLTQGEKTVQQLKTPGVKALNILTGLKEDLERERQLRTGEITSSEIQEKIEILKEELDSVTAKSKKQEREVKSDLSKTLKDTEDAVKAVVVRVREKYLRKLETSDEELDLLESESTMVVKGLEKEMLEGINSELEDAGAKIIEMTREHFEEYSTEIESRLNVESLSGGVQVARISLDTSCFNFDMEMDTYLQSKMKVQEELYELEDTYDDNSLRVTRARIGERNKKELREERECIRREYEKKREMMGRCPGIEQKSRMVERKRGLFKEFVHWFAGNGQKNYVTEYYQSDEARRQWIQEKEDLERAYSERLTSVNEELSQLQNQQSSEEFELELRRIERKIKRKEAQLKELQDEQNKRIERERIKKARKAKQYVEDCIAGFERECLNGALMQLRESRTDIVEAMRAILKEVAEDSLKSKMSDLEQLQMQQSEDQAENERQLRQIEERLEAVDGLLARALAFKQRVDLIEIDKIKRS